MVADIEVGNFSMILGWEWQYLTGGYLSLDGSRLIISHDRINIINMREPSIVPYIENVRLALKQLHWNGCQHLLCVHQGRERTMYLT